MRTTPIAVAALAALSLITLSGCGLNPRLVLSDDAKATVPTTAPGQKKTPKKCTPPEVPAVIDGIDKCLMIGQVCKPSSQSQYKQFGFKCAQEKGRWVIRRL